MKAGAGSCRLDHAAAGALASQTTALCLPEDKTQPYNEAWQAGGWVDARAGVLGLDRLGLQDGAGAGPLAIWRVVLCLFEEIITQPYKKVWQRAQTRGAGGTYGSCPRLHCTAHHPKWSTLGALHQDEADAARIQLGMFSICFVRVDFVGL